MSIANAFNSYFSNIGNELDNQISQIDSTPMDYLQSPVKDSSFIFPTSRKTEAGISSCYIFSPA